METNREKILSIIRENLLSAEETGMWENVLSDMPGNLSVEILLALENDPSSVRTLTDNLKEKVSAVVNHDVEKWSEILDKEKMQFNS